MVVVIGGEIKGDQLEKVKEEYGEYVKVVVDLDKEILAAGGEWHADGEKILLKQGSRQEVLWGGGVNLETKEIDFNSLINIRPGVSKSMEVVDVKIREKMEEIISRIFGRWLR